MLVPTSHLYKTKWSGAISYNVDSRNALFLGIAGTKLQTSHSVSCFGMRDWVWGVRLCYEVVNCIELQGAVSVSSSVWFLMGHQEIKCIENHWRLAPRSLKLLKDDLFHGVLALILLAIWNRLNACRVEYIGDWTKYLFFGRLSTSRELTYKLFYDYTVIFKTDVKLI